MDETQAIKRLKQGNLEGLEVLVRRYYDRAVRAAYGVVGDRAVAEDIVQECFIQAGLKISQFDSRRSFGPWFLRSVVNRAINTANQFRKTVPLEGYPDDAEEPLRIEQLIASLPGPEAVVEQEELQETVWRALNQLSPKQRAAVILRYYLELSEVEIMQEMAIPRSSVKWWLYTARERLRLLLHAFRPEDPEPVRCPYEPEETGKD